MTTDARKVLDKAASEDDLLTAVIEAALFLGYLVHHDRRSDKALQQGSPGFPDLVLARNGVVWFIECKSETGRQSGDQWQWESNLPRSIWACRYRLIRPADLDALLRDLADAR